MGAQEHARIRWSAGDGAPASGYRVHVRRADVPEYPAPLEVGAASQASDGTFEHVIDGLDPAAAYVVSVSAYGPDGASSPRSNEMMLPPRVGPCAFLTETAVCDAGDVCVAGLCRLGTCVLGQADARSPGSALTARLRVDMRGILKGVGAFVAPGILAPDVDGIGVEIVGASGALLQRLDVPADAFRLRRRHDGTVRWVATHGRLAGAGRLALRQRRAVLKIRLRMPLGTPLPSPDEPLTWIVRVNSACVRQVAVRCRAHGRGVRCN